MKSESKVAILFIAIVLAGVLMMLSFSILAVGIKNSGTVGGNTIEVSATKELKVAPDIAGFSFNVETRNADADAGKTENDKKVAAITEALKAGGMDIKNIQTTGYSVRPEYDYVEGKQIPKGSLASTTISVKDVSLDKIDALLAVAVKNGATSIYEVNFDLLKGSEKYTEALEQAIAKARVNADAMASAAGLQIIGVKSMTEGYTSDKPVMRNNVSMGDFAAKDATSNVESIEPGELEITASVNVTYLVCNGKR